MDLSDFVRKCQLEAVSFDKCRVINVGGGIGVLPAIAFVEIGTFVGVNIGNGAFGLSSVFIREGDIGFLGGGEAIAYAGNHAKQESGPKRFASGFLDHFGTALLAGLCRFNGG